MFHLVVIAACSAVIAYGALPGLDVEEMAAIQERLVHYEMMEEMLRSILYPEEKREEEKCLPEGSECKATSGPNCCGISTRCIVWDTQLPAKHGGGSATWISKCRKYKLGVALEAIGDAFKTKE
uniref:Putative neurotoxin LTDF S-05 n=1 Tax=Dolomedes fimbriatus TaxID=1432569 RepID=A0A0K1D9C4_9ARAC|nr:putative neurotoxin LTDF S-05 [Dolomedes fimbriatus]